MKRVYFTSLFFSLVVFACQKNALIDYKSSLEQKVVIEDENLYVPGNMSIRVSEKLASEIENARIEGGVVNGSQVKSMSSILLSSGVESVTRIFPYSGKFEERTRREGLHLWYNVVFDKKLSLTKAYTDFSKIDGVLEVELNREIIRFNSGNLEVLNLLGELPKIESKKTSVEPPFDDPKLSEQWHYYNNGETSGHLVGADINVFPVWKNYISGNEDVVVAVVDGGIDYDHEDLVANMWVNSAELNGAKGVDDDGNGYNDDIYGYNFVNKSGAISPESHGTHVAGTISATNNNGVGVCGVAGGDYKRGVKGVRLISCQIFTEDGSGGNAAEAIKYGADNGAVISQNSWGYEESTYFPNYIKAAIDYFVKYAGVDEFGNQTAPMMGGIVIFAAGNEGREEAAASYEKVLSVSSIGPNYVKASYSNYGSWVDIAAPGGSGYKGAILSTLPNNEYGYKEGTSMACPHVSGVAALLLSNVGGSGYTNEMLWERIVNNTKEIDTYNGVVEGKIGSGLLNALGSIVSGAKVPPDKVDEVFGVSNSNTISLNWLVTADLDDVKAFGYTIYYSKNSLEDLDVNNSIEVNEIFIETSDLDVGETISATLSDLDFETDYYIRVDAYDYSSNRSELSPMIIVKTEPNLKPVITPLDGTSLTLKAFQTKFINFKFTDPDGHPMTWSFKGGSNAVTAIQVGNDTIQLKIVGKDAPAADYNGEVTVTDKYGSETSLDFNYQIEKNTPPVLLKGIENLYVGSIAKEININLDEVFADFDGEILDYNIITASPSVAYVSSNLQQLVVISKQYGLTQVTVTATDVLNESVSTSFKILVRDDNNEIDLYPNPVIDNFNLRTGEELSADVSIISSTGAKVYDKKVSMGPFSPAQIDMSDLSGGVYTVIVKFNGKELKQNITKL